MKIICKENTAKNLDLKEVPNGVRKEHEFSFLVLGQEYLVMGIVGYRNRSGLYYLIDDGCVPNWMPYGLFEVSDKAFPSNWHIEVIDKKKDPEGVIFFLEGFYELCEGEDFYEALFEREPDALEVYWKRKNEVQQWYAERDEARKFYPKEAKIYYSIND